MFLLLLIFYLVGYKILFLGLHYRADISINRAIEQRTYNVEKTVTLRIPVSLPYQLFADGFQPVKGEFEYNGTYYNLVKQKIANDTLYIVCVENEIRSELQAKQNNFEKISNDWPGATKTTYSLLLSFSKDFFADVSPSIGKKIVTILELVYVKRSFDTLEGTSKINTPPPKLFIDIV